MSNNRYAYAVGRVRAMETQLLEKNKIDRMVDSLNAEEALKVLGETTYAEHFAGLKTLHDYDAVLDQELYRVYRELHQFSPQPELIGVFACRFDYHNLKVLFKAQAMDEKRDELLVEEIGRISPAVLVRAVKEDDYINLPPRMRQAAAQLSEILRLEPNPQIVDLLLDRAMFAEIFDMLTELDSPFLKEYFTSLVDLTNIKTYLRVKRAGYPREFLEQALLPFGELDITRMVQLADPPEVLIDRLMFSRYASFMEEAILAYQKTEALTRFEKLVDDFLLGQAKKAKYVTFGPEPLAAFIIAKENELKVIRIIMVGKVNQLPAEEIKERLRDVYV